MASLMKMPKFDPTKAGTAPPLISPAGDRMARNSGSRDWRETRIAISDTQSAFEEGVENGMENDPDMQTDFDDFLKQHRNETRSIGFERSSLRPGMKYESDDFS